MPIDPVPNMGVTVRAEISFWEVLTGLEFCEPGSALVWALVLDLALVQASIR